MVECWCQTRLTTLTVHVRNTHRNQAYFTCNTRHGNADVRFSFWAGKVNRVQPYVFIVRCHVGGKKKPA